VRLQAAQKLLVQLREYHEKQLAEQDRKERGLWSKAFTKNSEAGTEEVGQGLALAVCVRVCVCVGGGVSHSF
jgi:hypothetical protein